MSDNIKPLKIAMIMNRYLPIKGGAEMQANHLSRQLRNRGHSVNVITRKIQPEFASEEIVNDVPVQRLSPQGLSHQANALMFFRIFLFLLANAKKYDILHVHSIGPMGLATLLAGQITSTPTVMKIPTYGDLSRQQSNLTPSPYTRFIRKYILPQCLWRRVLSLSGAMIALTDEIIKEAQSQALESKTVKIPNGVNVEQFHPVDNINRQTLRDKLSLSQDDFIILFTGRLVHRKRVDVLIEAIHQVLQTHPNCHLLLAGSGQHQTDGVEDVLRQQVIERYLQAHVTFLGSIDNVVDYLQVADCFAFPSEREGMPNVVLEAMACGLPIIASHIDSITEILSEDMAYLVDVGDVDGFAWALQQIITQPEEAKRKGSLVLEHVRENYAIEIVAEQYEALYYKLISR